MSNTTDKVTVPHVLVFIFLYGKWEDKRMRNERWQAFPERNPFAEIVIRAE
jgi:hypothetical protein